MSRRRRSNCGTSRGSNSGRKEAGRWMTGIEHNAIFVQSLGSVPSERNANKMYGNREPSIALSCSHHNKIDKFHKVTWISCCVLLMFCVNKALFFPCSTTDVMSINTWVVFGGPTRGVRAFGRNHGPLVPLDPPVVKRQSAVYRTSLERQGAVESRGSPLRFVTVFSPAPSHARPTHPMSVTGRL